MLGPEDKIMCTDRLLFLRAKWVNPLTREKWVNTRCVNISRPTSYNSFQILELEATLLAEHAKLIKREELKKQHARF